MANPAFGHYDTNEMIYAKNLLAQIPDHPLTVWGKGLPAAEIACGLSSASPIATSSSRQSLIPVGSCPANRTMRWYACASRIRLGRNVPI